jgi:hypothetical protein
MPNRSGLRRAEEVLPDDWAKGLRVKLLGELYFSEDSHPCSKELYKRALGKGRQGARFPWKCDASFERMLDLCEDHLRRQYSRITTFELITNWLILLLCLSWFVVPGLFYLHYLSGSGDKRWAAAMLMAKRAYDLERVERQETGPDRITGNEDAVIVHHVLCEYYEKYIETLQLRNPFKTFYQYKKLMDLDRFISEKVAFYLDKYEWDSAPQSLRRVQGRVKDAFPRPRTGSTRQKVGQAAAAFTVIFLLFLGLCYTGNRVAITFGVFLLLVDIAVTYLYLWTWVPVARRVAGLTRGTFARWRDQGNISEDDEPIQAVTDLAFLAIRNSKAEDEDDRVSEQLWPTLLPMDLKSKRVWLFIIQSVCILIFLSSSCLLCMYYCHMAA